MTQFPPIPARSQLALFFGSTISESIVLLGNKLLQTISAIGVDNIEESLNNNIYVLRLNGQFEIHLQQNRLDFISSHFTVYSKLIVDVFQFLHTYGLQITRLGFINEVILSEEYVKVIKKLFKNESKYTSLKELDFKINQEFTTTLGGKKFVFNNIEQISKINIVIQLNQKKTSKDCIMLKKDINTHEKERYHIDKNVFEEFIVTTLSKFKHSDILDVEIEQGKLRKT